MRPSTCSCRALWALCLAALALPALSGCSSGGGSGGATGTVEGKVRLGKEYLKGGEVSFHPSGGQPVRSPIRGDGSYKVENVPVGEVTICVDVTRLKVAAQKIPEAAAQYEAVPAWFAKPDTSTLRYTVKPGQQEYEIPIQ
jgi:hypothetical protein